jgi:choline kinase
LAAVILAAGRGQRLYSEAQEDLKPLTPLLGLSLLERAALTCQEAGVTDCYVVVGYQQERLAAHIAYVASRYTMRLQAVVNPQWKAGNGTSALAVESYIRDPFLLLMCDHVFEVSILRCLLEAAQTSEASLLAVDHRIEQIFDPDDATKVQLCHQAITAIGKELTTYDAVDTGLFYCRPTLFEALRQAQAAGDGSLTGGIRRLITAESMQAVPIGERFWIDVDTAESLAYAQRMLLEHLQGPNGSLSWLNLSP